MSKQSGVRWSPEQYDAYMAKQGMKEAIVATKEQPKKRLLADRFESAWESINGPKYAAEVQVSPERRWAFDYCWIEAKVALELQGGIYMAGKGHVNPKQFRSDCDKLNYSNTIGIVMFKFATGQITPENIVMLRDFILKRLP